MTKTIIGTPGIQYKSVETQARTPEVNDLGDGVIEAIVSITGVKDNVNDIILPGAYEKSLKERTPKGVWHHSWTDPIAKTLDIKELQPGDPLLPDTLPDGSPWPLEAGALYVKMRFNLRTDKGRNAYEDVKFFGDSQEWSIGYKVPERKSYRRGGTRFIQELDLFEYSPVLFGAMSNARTTTVKDAQLAYKSLATGDDNNTEGVNNMSKMLELKAAASEFADAFYNVMGLLADLSNEEKSDDRDKILDLVEEMELDPEDFEDLYDDIDAGNLEAAQQKALKLTTMVEEKGGDNAVEVMESIAIELKSIEPDDEEDDEEAGDTSHTSKAKRRKNADDEDEDAGEDEDDSDEDEEEQGKKSNENGTEVKSIPLDAFAEYL